MRNTNWTCPDCDDEPDDYDPHLGLHHCPTCDCWFLNDTKFAEPDDESSTGYAYV